MTKFKAGDRVELYKPWSYDADWRWFKGYTFVRYWPGSDFAMCVVRNDGQHLCGPYDINYRTMNVRLSNESQESS